MESQFFELIRQPLADFRINKGDDPSTRLDQGDMDAQRGKDGGVFRANHTPAHDRHRFGNVLHIQDGIGIKDQLVIKWDFRRMMRRGAGGDQNDITGNFCLCPRGLDANRMRILERCFPMDERDILMPDMFARSCSVLC